MLEHPGIVPVYEIGRRDDGTLYYTQKLIRGRTLTEELSIARPRRSGCARCPTSSTSARHRVRARRGVIAPRHQADNVMVGEFGETVGSTGARQAEGARRPRPPAQGAGKEVQETQEGMVLGRPAYIEPEQACRWHLGRSTRRATSGAWAVLYRSHPACRRSRQDGDGRDRQGESQPVVPVARAEQGRARELAASLRAGAQEEEACNATRTRKRWPTRCSPAERRARLRVRVFLRRLLRRLVARNKKLTAVVRWPRCWSPSAAVLAPSSTARRGGSWRAPFRERSAQAETDLRWTAAMVLRRRRAASWTQPDVDFRIAQGPPRDVSPAFAIRTATSSTPLAFSTTADARGRPAATRTIRRLAGPGGKRRARLEGNELHVISMSWNAPRSRRRPGRDHPAVRRRSAELVSKLEAGPPQHAVAFSPDGDRLAARRQRRRVRLWEVPAQGTGVELVGTTARINALSFSGRWRHLATHRRWHGRLWTSARTPRSESCAARSPP